MTVVNLAESFRSGNGRKTKWNGQEVYSMLQITVNGGDTVVIEQVKSSQRRAQAIKVGVNKGNLRANGILTETAAIWTHTAPDSAALKVVGSRAKSIDVWNSWSFDGVDSSWLGNAGMMVETNGQIHTLRCSDGVGDVSFDDLIVTLRVIPGA